MSLQAPNRVSIVEKVNRENPGLIYQNDLEFCRLVICECNKIPGEEGKWGFNGKRGNPNDKSRDCVAFLNSAVPWGCSIIDIIGNHPLPTSSPAWIDQTQATLDKGEVGVFIKADCGNLPNPEPEPEPVPTPCKFTDICKFVSIPSPITREEFESLALVVKDTNAKLTELKNRLMGGGDQSLDDIVTRLDRNYNRIPIPGSRNPIWRG